MVVATYESGRRRRGAALVESAMVLSLVCMFIFGLVIGGMGIFYYQSVSLLAREAARYASVHGTNYQTDTGNGSVSSVDIYNAAIVPMASGLDLSKLTYSITYNGASSGAWDSNTHLVQYVSGGSGGTPKTATVSVTVNYNWTAALYFGTVNLSSTSTMPMMY
jgi:Flp pilus assembly protein TadG